MSTPTKLRSIIWLPLVAFMGLYGLMLSFVWRQVEQDVAESVRAALSQKGYDWVEVDLHNRGRDVLLKGTAPSLSERDEAGLLAARVEKVRLVDNKIIVTELMDVNKGRLPLELEWFANGERIHIKGLMPSQEQIDALLAQAYELYSIDHVSHELSVNEQASTLINSKAFFEALAGAFSPRTIVVKEHTLLIEGDIRNEDERLAILSGLSRALGVDVIIEDKLVIAEQAAIEFVEEQEPVAAQVPEEIVGNAHCGRIFQAFLALQTIEFTEGKPEIQEASYSLLDSLALVANKCPNADFEVGVYGDQALSQQRAQAIVDFLAKKGVNGERMTAVGYEEGTENEPHHSIEFIIQSEG